MGLRSQRSSENTSWMAGLSVLCPTSSLELGPTVSSRCFWFCMWPGFRPDSPGRRAVWPFSLFNRCLRVTYGSTNKNRRLARRGGVKRISGTIYEEARLALKKFLESVRPNEPYPLGSRVLMVQQIIRDVVTYTEHRRAKTVTVNDVSELSIGGHLQDC
jgi:histone H3/H4